MRARIAILAGLLAASFTSSFALASELLTAGSISVPLGERFSTRIDVSGEKNYASSSEDDDRDSMIFGGGWHGFGAESLKANDRRGATLDQPSLPMRAVSWVEPLD